ncbi:PQQ-binding-like beta-propeller repeat protein [Microbulbifer thermotolerans]|nr:PQQ-binding-like beta-propeller repeat protein [Microbulbifer thermotolerans]
MWDPVPQSGRCTSEPISRWDEAWTPEVAIIVNKPEKPGKPTINSLPNELESEDGTYSIGWQAPTTGDFDYYLVQEKKVDGPDWCADNNPYNTKKKEHGICYAQKSSVSSPRSYSVNNRPVGSYQYRVFACNALQCGDPSAVKTVNVQPIPDPQVSWRTPTAGALLRAGDFQTLRVQVTDDRPIVSVKLYRNSVSSNNLLDYPVNPDNQCGGCYAANWPSVSAGTTKLIAVAENDAGKEGTATIPVSVSTNAVPEVGFDLDALPEEIVAGEDITLVARARDSDGSIASVEFLVGGAVVGSGTYSRTESGWNVYEYLWAVPAAGDYRLGARATDDEGATAETHHDVHFTALEPPKPPTQIRIDDQLAPIPDNVSGYYTVSWNEVAGATHGYLLQQLMVGVDDDFKDVPVPSGASSVYLPNQTQGSYRYRVAACNAAGCGDFSGEITVDVVLSAPQAPIGLMLQKKHSEYDLTGTYSLTWQLVTSKPKPDYYQFEEIEGGADSANEWRVLKLGSSAAKFEITDKPSGTYSYRVRACNAYDCSAASEVATVAVLPPSLLSAEPGCDGACLLVSGSGLDPDSVFTLTDRESGAQEVLDKSAVSWTAPGETDPATYAHLALSDAMRSVLFDPEKKGLRVSVENTNGERSGINAYGDKTIERLSQIDSAPAVGADGTIYVGSGNRVYALDPEDGSVVSGWPFSTGDLVKATPAVDSVNGNIYVGSLDDNLYALTPLGLEQWRLQTGGDLVASAVLDENRILYQGSMDGVLYAVQAQNGAIQWTYPASAGIAETPVLAGNGTLYFTTVGSSQVYALGRGILGPDQLVWESNDESLLREKLEDENWQPGESQLPEYQTAARLYKLLLQPPLNLSRDVLTFWTFALVNGAGVEEVANAFLKSDTGKANFPPTQGSAAFVDALYARAFPGLEQPAFTYAGQTYTRGSLIDAMTGGTSRAQVAALFAQSVEYTAATNEALRRSFDYFYTQDYSWAVFSCDEGDEYTRDCDSDGLPDYWEILFFGSEDIESGDSDADGDGLSNREAFLAGLDPCANRCRYGVTAEAPAPAPMPALDAGQVAISSQVGSLPGQFRVNETGAASYSIPLSLPAGTAGVAPEISLNYSSQAGNGLVGHGWSIGGLSAIARCRQTLGQDGQAKAITWSSEDRFCLDGQRLLVVEGEYGEPGSLYRTEIDSFALIKAHGGEAGHPAYFTVERKDGSISYYGDGNKSQQTTGQGTLTWAISRFEDSAGNPIEFVYANDGGHRISEIRYAFTGTGSSAGAKVVFDYKGRSDHINGYLAGELLETGVRLETVYVYNGSSEVRRYELEYLGYPADSLSRLERIRQCAGNYCQPDTVFDWRLPVPGSFAASPSDRVTLSTQEDRASVGTRPADINGDGRMDLIWLEPDWDPDGDGGSEIDYQIFKYVLATENGFSGEYSVYQEEDNTRRPYDWQMIDYNADGRADLVTYLEDLGHWGVVLSQPDADGNWFLSGSPRHLSELTQRDAKFVDIDGDGLVDYLTHSEYRLLKPGGSPTGNSYYRFGQSNPVTLHIDWSQVEWDNPVDGEVILRSATVYSEAAPADFNGDGLVDPFVKLTMRSDCIPTSGFEKECQYSGGIAIVTSSALGEYESYHYLGTVNSPEAVDINGDGLPDIVYRRGETGYYRINTGAGFGEAVSLGKMPKQRQYFDYDNDGHIDIVWHDKDARRLKVKRWRSLDKKFGQPESFRETSGDEYALHLFVDMNGDGVSDYVRAENDRAFLYPATDFRVPVNVIEKITNGLGAETDIAYGSLTHSGHYTRRDIAATTEKRCDNVHYGDTWVEPVEEHYPWCRDYAVADLADYYGYLNDAWEGEDRLGKLSPTLELMGPMYVVTRVDSSAPTATDSSAKSAVSYYYAQAKIQAGGRGMLGFEKLTTVDEQTGVQTTTSYRQDFPFLGYPQSTEVKTAEGHLLSRAVNTWKLKNADGEDWQEGWSQTAKTAGSAKLGPLQPWLAQSVETSYALKENGAAQGGELNTVTTENRYDRYGNPTWIKVTTIAANGDSFTTETWNTYGSESDSVDFADRDEMLSSFPELGRLTRTEVEHRRSENGESDEERRISSFGYYRSGRHAGLMEWEKVEPDTDFELTTTYTYDGFGNKATVTQSAEGEEARSSSWEYENDQGRYLSREFNAYGQTTRRVIERNQLGLPIAVADMAGVVTEYRYDLFGRKLLEYSETGAHSITLLAAAGSHCPAGSVYQQSIQQAGGAESLSCFDALAREIRSATRGFDGNWVYADTQYDALGRVVRKSEPFRGSAQYWTEMRYDILGRVTGTDLPGTVSNNGLGVDVHVDYQGYTTVTTNPEGHTKTETKNARGELVSVVDNLGGRLDYRYDAQGNLTTVTRTGEGGALSTVTEMRYDKLGRKEYMNDPDKGEWHYGYNGFGELEWQIDAKRQMVVNQYDRLGRMVRRTDYRNGDLQDPDALNADDNIEGDTLWTYNNSTGWDEDVPPGALSGVIDIESGYAQVPGYDRFGRPDSQLTSLAPGDDHWTRTTYDQYGRVFQQFDAGGDGTWRSSATENRYNNYGYLEAVVDGENINHASAENYYTVLAMDERGNVTEFRQGNGVVTVREYDPATGRLEHQSASLLGVTQVQDLTYQWDNLGNLDSRRDRSGGKDLFEEFQYDGLNRLKSAQVSGRAAQTVDYDGLGNIAYKSDVGDYRYGSQCAEGYGPHAVCETSDGVSYHYDANGNMTSDSSGRNLQYSTFDKPLVIEKNGHTTKFQYGPDRSRYLRVDIDSSGKRTETRYIGNVEKITRSDGSREIKRYLPGGAVVTLVTESDGATSRSSRYLHKDHLGSVDVITDASGTVVQAMSFDAWGQRRNAQSWETLIGSELTGFDTGVTTRGYTGHEMLDQVGLIHMNGRIYDARLGRFLQADPFVQAASDTQMFNRYGYVRNNPLNATDPSGYFVFTLTAMAYVAFAEGVKWYAVGLIMGAAGFADAIMQGATFKQALKTGFLQGISAAAFAGIGEYFQGLEAANNQQWAGFLKATGMETVGLTTEQVMAKWAAHALVGGVMSVLQGGKFGHGFVSAGLTQALSGGISKIGGSPQSSGYFSAGNRALRIFAAAIVGGTASKISGGKFANGAVTGAFSRALNDEVHSFARKVDGFFKGLWKKATDWHFEGRDARNGNLPSYEQATGKGSEWDLLPPEQSIFHDNGVGKPELKFIHPDGREAVFDGDTLSLVTDPKYVGTYNYVNPAPVPDKWYDVGGWGAYAGKGLGHLVLDVVPYWMGGNVRGEN